MLAVGTYQIARTYLLQQRDALVVRQAGLNARAVNAAPDGTHEDLSSILANRPTSSRSYGVVRLDGEWIASAVPADGYDVPPELVKAALNGEAVKQRLRINGTPTMIVGIPLTRASGAYFEVAPLNELQRTLSVIMWSLAAGAGVAAVLGALVGLYASRRVLRPLRQFSDAADEVRRGRFDTRVSVENDPDLAGIGDAFNEMAESLQSRTERDARFASDVSHELRNPLTALSAAVDVVGRRADEQTRPAVNVLRDQVDHFNRLLLDLLELSRLDSGASPLDPEDVAPRAYFPAILSSLGVGESVIEISDDVPNLMRLDKRRVERVLVNLIDNAEKHGRGVSRVQIQRAGATGVAIAIEDCGPGVPVAERRAVFDRFHRGARQPADRQGSGLGLAIVAEHCRAHRGTVRVEDSPSGGARFVAVFSDGVGR